MNNKWIQGRFNPRNPSKYRGDVSAIKYRSSWEFALMRFLDNTDEILAWESEETIIKYFDPIQNKQRRYFVDFKAAIKQHDGSIKVFLIEIKPYKQTIKPRQSAGKSEKTLTQEHHTWVVNQAKWAAARELCKQRNWEFLVITEKVLFAGIDKGYKAPRKKRRLGA